MVGVSQLHTSQLPRYVLFTTKETAGIL